MYSSTQETELIRRSKCPVGKCWKEVDLSLPFCGISEALCNLTLVCVCMHWVRSLVLAELLIWAWFALEYLTLWITINDLPWSRGFGTGIPSFLMCQVTKYLWSPSRPPGSIPWLEKQRGCEGLALVLPLSITPAAFVCCNRVLFLLDHFYNIGQEVFPQGFSDEKFWRVGVRNLGFLLRRFKFLRCF